MNEKVKPNDKTIVYYRPKRDSIKYEDIKADGNSDNIVHITYLISFDEVDDSPLSFINV